VPAHVVALVMKAEPGAELACRARNCPFVHQGSRHERGVISYHAAQMLPQATTLASWLQLIEARASADVHQDRLPGLYQPSLQILGPAATRLPGDPVSGDAEPHQ
jgi:hypothetical protein